MIPPSRFSEILFARALPGFISVTTIGLLAAWLNAFDYGVFSTTIVTSGVLVNIIFGCIKFAIIPQYSAISQKNEQGFFDSLILGFLALLSFIFLLVALLFFAFSYTHLGLGLLLIISIALFDTLQNIARAKLKFWKYGFAYLSQATVFLVLIINNQDEITLNLAIFMFTCSNFIGFLIAFILGEKIKPKIYNIKRYKDILAVGVPVMSSYFTESILFIGFRYVLLFFGSAQNFGAFSFAVDLAQKTVGVFVNLMSFALVPQAYRSISEGSFVKVKNTLLRSAQFAGSLGCLVVVIIVATNYIFNLKENFGLDAFSTFHFIIISVAVLINRSKKMIIDPILISRGNSVFILKSYVISAFLSLLFSMVCMTFNYELGVLWIYLATYAGIGIVSYMAVKRQYF